MTTTWTHDRAHRFVTFQRRVEASPCQWVSSSGVEVNTPPRDGLAVPIEARRTPTISTMILAIAAMVSACGSGGGGGMPDAPPRPDASITDAAPDTAIDAPPGAVPRVQAAACKFEVSSSLGLAEGTGYDCGDLIVHEDRASQNRTIAVHFIRFKKGATPSPRATIYLDGGPGGNGQNMVLRIGLRGTQFLDDLHVDGDFLVIAQRGTSLSMPDASANPAYYNTAYNADDVDDLRASLGYEQLNVWGISYGSRLGLEVLRRHPDKVRAASIGGLVPSQLNWVAHIPASFYSALRALDASCAAAGACGSTFGGLEAKFLSGLSSLGSDPLAIPYQGDSFDLDAGTYAGLLMRLLYAKSTYPWLPMVISDIAERRADRIGTYLGDRLTALSQGEGVSPFLYYAVVCGELFNPVPDESVFETANAGVPAAIRDMFSGSWVGRREECAADPVGPIPAGLAAPVTSSVRTLVDSGALDPITPPSFADVAAQSLSDRVVVVFPNSGHGATLQSTCGERVMFEFFANPTAAPDTACVPGVTTAYMLGTAVAPPTIPSLAMDLELQMFPFPDVLPVRMRRR